MQRLSLRISAWLGALPRRAATYLFFGLFGIAAASLASAPLELAPSALQQIQALKSIKSSLTATQAKIGSRLMLAAMHQTPAIATAEAQVALNQLPDFRFIQPESDGRVAVEIILTKATGMKPVLAKLETLGEVVKGKHAAYGQVSARVRLQNLEELAAMAVVKKVREAIPFMTQKVNTSEGDATHDAANARGFYGATGTGVTIGVISDGVDSLASLQASGDLPASVQVLPGQAGTGNEGSAMLEIVHDLAPGATLVFATANPSEAQFAQNILDLAAAGCDIIVDDIIYLDESPFQDGPVAQAVNTVTAAGVLYFSSAGNEGNALSLTSGTWEGDFAPNGTPAVLAGAGPVHNFGDGGQSISVASAAGDPPLLIWAEHYDLATGNASTDFDLYDLDNGLTTIFDASTDTQDGAGGDDFPVEYIGGGTYTNERLVVAQFAAGATSSTPMFNLIVFRGELNDSLATGGATRGHSAAADAFSVAATPIGTSFDGISATGPYPGVFTAANAIESFSSDGPRRIILNAAGTELTPGNRTSTGGVVRQKPDITAADGVSTAAPGFSTFYGTSAAAPHAAAIAALLKSAIPTLTPAQVRTHLISSAIDIQAAGVDSQSGAGIVMASAALQAAGATPQPYLAVGTAVPTQVFGDSDGIVETNEVHNLSLPLTNSGGSNATGISAVLTSSTPGVTINAGASAYADLAPSATLSNTTPFTFTVGPSVPCGTLISFSLTVTYSGSASPQTFDFTLRDGAPGTPATFGYTGAAVAIPDAADLTGNNPGAAVTADLAVSGLTGTVYDVDFRFDGSACSNAAGSTTVGLDHTFVNDLHLTLRSPSGTTVLIADEADGSGNNFCQTTLDDESAGTPIQSAASASAPFTGSFTPNSPLSTFDAGGANGTWQLQAQDFYSGDTGNIRAFSLIVTPAVCNAPPLGPVVSATMTSSGVFAVGNNVTYTIVLSNTGTATAPDNPGDEMTDVLPNGLTLITATATSGTVTTSNTRAGAIAPAAVGDNTVSWNGAIPAGGSVTIDITARIGESAAGQTLSNQATFAYDADLNGSNETDGVTDDPDTGTAGDATSNAVQAVMVAVPTLSDYALALLSAFLVVVAAGPLRRRSGSSA